MALAGYLQAVSGSEKSGGGTSLARGSEVSTVSQSMAASMSAMPHTISFNCGRQDGIDISSSLARRKHGWAGAVVESDTFAMFINASIVISAVQMGVQADVSGDLLVWDICEHVFTAIFAVEMVLKIWVERWSYFADYWNILDCLIAWVSIVYAWVLPVAQARRGAAGSGTNLSIIKVFRLLRLFRVMKLMKSIAEFRMVIEGIAASMRALFWVCLLLLVTVYTFAIFCVEVVGSAGADTYPGFAADDAGIKAAKGIYDFNNYEYFGDLGRAMLSLFSISLLAEWDIIRPVWEFQRYCVPLFLALVFITSFGIVNVIIGVIVESTTESMQEMQAHKREEAKRDRMEHIEDLAENLWEHDADGSGEISREEMRSFGKNPKIHSLLETLDLPKGFTFDDLFTMLNVDGKGDLSKKDFLVGMHRLIFGTPFQKDCLQFLNMGQVLCIQRDVQGLQEKNADALESLKREVQSIRRDLLGALSAGPPEPEAAAAFSSHGWRAGDEKQGPDSAPSPDSARSGGPRARSPVPQTSRCEGDAGPQPHVSLACAPPCGDAGSALSV